MLKSSDGGIFNRSCKATTISDFINSKHNLGDGTIGAGVKEAAVNARKVSVLFPGLVKAGTVSPEARHRSDVFLEVCSPGVKQRTLVPRFEQPTIKITSLSEAQSPLTECSVTVMASWSSTIVFE